MGLPTRTTIALMKKAKWTPEHLMLHGFPLEDAQRFFETGRWQTLEQEEKFARFADIRTGVSSSVVDHKTGRPLPDAISAGEGMGLYYFQPPTQDTIQKLPRAFPPVLLPEVALAPEGQLIKVIQEAQRPA